MNGIETDAAKHYTFFIIFRIKLRAKFCTTSAREGDDSMMTISFKLFFFFVRGKRVTP